MIRLLTSRRLLPLLVTQSLGALNDNMVKSALVVLILFGAGRSSGQALVVLAGGVFILPYMLLSAAAGQMADRFEKSRSAVAVKGLELLLMLLAALGFLRGSTALLFVVLFGLGMQATLFGPLKYALLPSLLEEAELVAGNGLMEAGTFGGILAGTILGTVLIGLPGGAAAVSAVGLATAAAGLATAWLVPRAPAAAPGLRVGWNPLRETAGLLRLARANRPVWLSLLALSWFWVLGATVVAELSVVVRDDLRAAAPVYTLLLVVFSVGVGAGSVGSARLLRGAVSARFVPLASLGMAVFLADFARAAAGGAGLASVAGVLHSLAGWRLLADLLLLAACGGLYSVPLYAVLQAHSAPAQRSRMVAANNVVNAVAIVLGAMAVAVMAACGLGAPAILLVAALSTVLVAGWSLQLLPRDSVRAAFARCARALHGVTVSGLEHLPPPGTRAVLVVNHQSLADSALVAAFLPGDLVFAVNRRVARRPWARLLLAAVHALPLDPASAFGVRTMVRAVRVGGRLVVFPEGRLTSAGALMKVYEGIGMVADQAGAVLVPVRIDGLQSAPPSRLASHTARRWFPHVSITVLPPAPVVLAPTLRGRRRRQAAGILLQRAMLDAGLATAQPGRALFAALLDASACFGAGLPILEDTARVPLPYRRVVLGAAVLGRRLAREAALGEAVGLLLPNATGTVVTFMALQAWGRVPAMLNLSAGPEAVLAACAAAGVRTVLTSRVFVERGKLRPLIARLEAQHRVVWLEDVRAALGPAAKLRGLLDTRRARRLPGARVAADRPAAILFTSGSEGAPKGVVLSHRNILANIAQVVAVADFSASDRVFNAMPMFHSLGLTGATLLPLLCGVRCFLYPSPLHYRVVPEMIYETRSTIAFGSDTFLSSWARFAHPYDFHAMRIIYAGAEVLREETRRLYAERFGVRLLEGYGVTEASPVLALNTAMYNQPGTVGRLLPGIRHRLEPVEGIAEGGRLLVSGPNVMLGYVHPANPGTVEPAPGGWHDTGDVCTVDADGFVRVVARAKRFAKIGGEMVSMPAAEALVGALWPDALHAVVARPDPRKGEALLLLTTEKGATTAALLAHARARSVAEIAVPRMLQVVESLPLLPSGKVDYVALGRIVAAGRQAA